MLFGFGIGESSTGHFIAVVGYADSTFWRGSARAGTFISDGQQWNKIEHRLSSFISSNWRGEPLRDYETRVKLISRTTTAKCLTDPFFFISSQGFFSKGYKSTILPPKAPALVS